MIQNVFHLTEFCSATTSFKYFKPFGRTSKIIPPPWYKGGLMEPLARVFDITFDRLNKMRYNFWVVALLEVCDVTKHGRHLSPHLEFYQELEIRLKRRE